MLPQIVFLLFSVSVAVAQYGHGHGHHAAPYEVYGHAPAHYDVQVPQPYDFGYEIKDGYEGSQHRHEKSDEHGNVRGSYGYVDPYGVYRRVDYVADKHGFRANVKTNEPGTANQNPANVDVSAKEAVPAKVEYHHPAPVPVASYKHVAAPVHVLPGHHGHVYPQPPVTYAVPAHKTVYAEPSYAARSYAPAVHAVRVAPVYHAAPRHLVPGYGKHDPYGVVYGDRR